MPRPMREIFFTDAEGLPHSRIHVSGQDAGPAKCDSARLGGCHGLVEGLLPNGRPPHEDRPRFIGAIAPESDPEIQDEEAPPDRAISLPVRDGAMPSARHDGLKGQVCAKCNSPRLEK